MRISRCNPWEDFTFIFDYVNRLLLLHLKEEQWHFLTPSQKNYTYGFQYICKKRVIWIVLLTNKVTFTSFKLKIFDLLNTFQHAINAEMCTFSLSIKIVC